MTNQTPSIKLDLALVGCHGAFSGQVLLGRGDHKGSGPHPATFAAAADGLPPCVVVWRNGAPNAETSTRQIRYDTALKFVPLEVKLT